MLDGIKDKEKTFKGLIEKKMRFKIVISKENEILVFYSDPELIKKQEKAKEFEVKSADGRN